MRNLVLLQSDRQFSERRLNNLTSPRFEALPTGLFPEMEVLNGESVEEFQTLVCDFYDEYQPDGPSQRCLVDLVANSEWQLRRYRKVEAQLYDVQCGVIYANAGGGNACEAYALKIEVFARLHRRIESCERGILRAIRELERLGCTRRPVPAQPRPEAPSAREILAAPPEPPPPDAPEPDPALATPQPPPPVRLTTPDLPLDFPTRRPPSRKKLASFDQIRRRMPDPA